VSNTFAGTFGAFGDPSKQYVATIQATLAFNIFAGGETRAAVERARAQARRAQAAFEQAEEQVADEVAAARQQVLSLAASLTTAHENLAAADRGLKLTRDRLDAGVGSQLEVRDANLKLTQAKLTWINTVADFIVARADLNRAIGGGGAR